VRFKCPGSYLDAHALQVVQRIHKAGEITAISQLVACDIVFEQGSVDVIVRWISVDKSVQEESVEGKPPIVRGCGVHVALPFPRVLQWVQCLLVSVEVPVKLRWVEWRCSDLRC